MQGSGKTWFSEQLNDVSRALSDQSVGGDSEAGRPCPPRYPSRHPGCCDRTRAGAHWDSVLTDEGGICEFKFQLLLVFRVKI